MNIVTAEFSPKQGSLLLEHFRSRSLIAIRGKRFLFGNVPRLVGNPNLVTEVGKALFANLFIGQGTAPSHIALGDGTEEAADDDTALENELYREAAERTRTTTDVENDTSQYTFTFTADDTYELTEGGLLNAAEGGTLSCRQVFTALPVKDTDTIRATWRLQH